MIDEIPGDLLQWLRGFYYVARSGSVTQATTMMGREQPTITRQIKCLERELGVTLFDRSSGTMKLTSEGRVLFEKAVTLFEDIKTIRNEFKKKQRTYKGKIIIATSHWIVESFLPKYIVDFSQAHPQVAFHIEGGFFNTALAKVESSEADFGIVFTDIVSGTLTSHDLFETGMKLIAPRQSTFFSGTSPTLKEIAKVPLILFAGADGSIDPLIRRRFAAERLQPKVILTHNNFISVKKYVSLGMGAALLAGIAVSEEDEKTFDVFPLDKYFPRRKVGIVVRERKYLSPAAKAFINMIKQDVRSAG